jgi:hypothetical protein
MLFADLRASAWKYASIACAVLAVAALVACLIFWGRLGHALVRADAAESRAKALAGELQSARNVIAIERRRAADMAKLADQYEQDKRNAKADQDRLAADLRAGNVRLRSLWQGCEATSRVSATGGSSGDPDAAAADRGESAARIVRAARDADDQIKRLQEVIRKDRGATK